MNKLGFKSTTMAARNFGERDAGDFVLVLALIDLANLDGYSILEGLTRKAGKTPVIVVGERSSRGKIVEKLLGRPLAYLSTPIQGTQLKDAVQQVLAPAPKLEDAPTERWDQPWQRPDLRLTEVIDGLRTGEVDLPTIGPIAMELHQLLQRPTAGVEETVGVVEQDPAVAAGVLRLANSSRYRAIVPIMTLRNACLRLGNKTVVALAQEAVLRDLFALGAGPVQQIAHAMWQSVVVTSQGARQIAIEKGIANPDEIQVAAMFHNLGELVLMRATAGLYRDPNRWENPIFLASLGREIALYHGEVGALLLRGWGMDESFIRVTEHHHSPGDVDLTERERTLCHVVLAAWAGAEQAGFGWRMGGRRTRAHRALYSLHLTEVELLRIFEGAESWVAGSLPLTPG
jgi:HD-like signal output (HDOD) protein